MSLFQELKRRNVFKVVIAYVITAWILLQFADLVLENIHAPDWVIQTFMLALALGFPLAAIFAWAFEMTPEGIKKEKDVDRTESITHVTGRKLDFTIIGVMALALIYFAADKFLLSTDSVGENTEHTAQTTVIPANAGIQAEPSQTTAKSIAVLPFVNMSDDASNEYFSDGIAEEILNALARVKELKVAGRTSSFAFKGENQDLRQIGEMLGVEHILEGSVRKAGNKVRITAQLIQVNDGFHLWSNTYDRELTDVFAIQDEIATAILGELKAQLLDGGGESSVVTAKVTNPEVYDLYLLARQRIYARNNASIDSAATLLDKAISIDPEYAPAYAMRGIAAALLSDENYGSLTRNQANTTARLYLDKAIGLDPNLAEAWAGLGLVHASIPGEHDQAIEVLNKALEINPNLIDASNWLFTALMYAGRHTETLAVIEGMVESDPLYPPGIGNAIITWNRIGQQDKSFELIERVRPFMGESPFLWRNEAITHFSLGDWATGLPLAEQAHSQQPTDGVFRGSLGFGLLAIHQYERLIDLGDPFFKVLALKNLGRVEEATILAREEAAQGDIDALFNVWVRTGHGSDLIQFLEDKWPDLAAFEAEYPSGGGGYGLMLDVANAYGTAGNSERFEDAMTRVRAAHDELASAGLQSPFFKISEAEYHVLAGDYKMAKEFLSASIDAGLITTNRLADGFVAFVALEGDPEYEAIQTRMIENLNRQRAMLGLEPATI